MIFTIRRTSGSKGLEEVLGPIDATHFEAEARRTLALQLEDLVDLTSSHEPTDTDCCRYEVEVQGPGRAHNLLTVEDTGDPELPTHRALTALMRTLGLAVPSTV